MARESQLAALSTTVRVKTERNARAPSILAGFRVGWYIASRGERKDMSKSHAWSLLLPESESRQLSIHVPRRKEGCVKNPHLVSPLISPEPIQSVPSPARAPLSLSNLKCPQISLLLPAVLPFSRSASAGMSPVSNTFFTCANMYG